MASNTFGNFKNFKNFSNFQKIERFQASSNSNSGGTNLDKAYVKGSSIANIVKPVSVNNTTEEEKSVDETTTAPGATILQSSKSIGFPETLWDFLGFNRLTKKQRDCSFDCGMEGLNCATNCENEFTPEKRKMCKYQCLKKGLQCTKSCVETHQSPVTHPVLTTPMITTSSTIPTTNTVFQNEYVIGLSSSLSQNNTTEEQKLIEGVCPCDDNSAPYDTNLWPSHHQAGWDNQTLKNYRKNQGDEEIEVLVNSNLFPLKSDNPELVFGGDSKYNYLKIELDS